MSRHYFKQQSIGSYYMPTVQGVVERDDIRLRLTSGFSNDPDAPLHAKLRREVFMSLTAHEAMSLAAWLSDNADRILKRKAKAAARRAERRAKS